MRSEDMLTAWSAFTHRKAVGSLHIDEEQGCRGYALILIRLQGLELQDLNEQEKSIMCCCSTAKQFLKNK